MIQPNDVELLQSRFGLTYHVPFSYYAQEIVGFAGKTVVEVGGSLPAEFALRVLGAAKWVAVEEPGYWREIAEEKTWGDISPLVSARNVEEMPEYSLLSGRVENAPPALDRSFDLAFSIAAFEHMDRFPASLAAIHDVLKPGGALFSLFSPVWSASDGHHLPKLENADGTPFDPGLIPRWGHLLMSPPEMYRHLRKHADDKTCAEVVHYIYNSPHINRLFIEDYINYVRETPFVIEHLHTVFVQDMDDETRTKLENRHPGYKTFSAQGLFMLLRRR